MTDSMPIAQIRDLLTQVEKDAKEALSPKHDPNIYIIEARASCAINTNDDIDYVFINPRTKNEEIKDAAVASHISVAVKYSTIVEGYTVWLGQIAINLPYDKNIQQWPVHTIEGKPFCGQNMTFSQALAWLEAGRSVRLPNWKPGEFLCFNKNLSEKKELMMYRLTTEGKRKAKPFKVKHEFLTSENWELYT